MASTDRRSINSERSLRRARRSAVLAFLSARRTAPGSMSNVSQQNKKEPVSELSERNHSVALLRHRARASAPSMSRVLPTKSSSARKKTSSQRLSSGDTQPIIHQCAIILSLLKSAICSMLLPRIASSMPPMSFQSANRKSMKIERGDCVLMMNTRFLEEIFRVRESLNKFTR